MAKGKHSNGNGNGGNGGKQKQAEETAKNLTQNENATEIGTTTVVVPTNTNNDNDQENNNMSNTTTTTTSTATAEAPKKRGRRPGGRNSAVPGKTFMELQHTSDSYQEWLEKLNKYAIENGLLKEGESYSQASIKSRLSDYINRGVKAKKYAPVGYSTIDVEELNSLDSLKEVTEFREVHKRGPRKDKQTISASDVGTVPKELFSAPETAPAGDASGSESAPAPAPQGETVVG